MSKQNDLAKKLTDSNCLRMIHDSLRLMQTNLVTQITQKDVTKLREYLASPQAQLLDDTIHAIHDYVKGQQA